jgi:hypothetical protein
MWRHVRDGLTVTLVQGVALGGFVLLEPPIVADPGGTWSADTGRAIHQWTFVSAFDVATACDAKRTARQANAAADLGVDAESDRPGTKLGAVFDARRRSRCVADTEFFGAPKDAK